MACCVAAGEKGGRLRLGVALDLRYVSTHLEQGNTQRRREVRLARSF